MELRKFIKENETDVFYEYVTYQDIIDLLNDDKIIFDIPRYERYNYQYESCISRFKDKLEWMAEKYNNEDRLRNSLSSESDELIDGEALIWLSDMISFKDPISGYNHGWTYLNPKTNTITIHKFDTKEKLVSQPLIENDTEDTIEIDVPSGQLVFGYYSVFEIFKNRDEQLNNYADYFDSEQGRKNFNDLYESKNVAMWYDGNFEIHQKVKDKNDKLIFSKDNNTELDNKISQIEHDKCSCFVDLEILLNKVKENKSNGIKNTFKNTKYDEVEFTRENIIKESKQDNIFKALDIIEVPKGRYRITILKKDVRCYSDDCPEDMKEYGDYLNYTIIGGMELIKKF